MEDQNGPPNIIQPTRDGHRTPDFDTQMEMDNSQPGSAGGVPRKGKKVVGFSHGNDTVDTQNRPRSWLDPSPTSHDRTPPSSVLLDRPTPVHSRNPSFSNQAEFDRSHLPQLSPEITRELRQALAGTSQTNRPRPVLRRGDSNPIPTIETTDYSPGGTHTPQEKGAREAYERGKRLERRQAKSNPGSRRQSPVRDGKDGSNDIPLQPMFEDAIESDSDEDDGVLFLKRQRTLHHTEAEKLVKSHAAQTQPHYFVTPPREFQSGAVTPTEEYNGYEFDAPRPEKMRGGVLGMLLSLYNQAEAQAKKSPGGSRKSSFVNYSSKSTPNHSPNSSGTTTPVNHLKRPWYGNRQHSSTGSLAKLIGSSSMAVSPAVSGLGAEVAQRIKEKQAEEEKAARAKKRNASSTALSALNRLSQPKQAEQFRITVHIAETIARQRYLEKLCRALMEYGAPTHRLEEYMKMSARVLEIELQCLYLPGSMIISFDDSQTHTAAVRLVRVAQGLDLGKLHDVHELYKEVVHDRIAVEEATRRLNEIRKRKQKYNKWLLILVYGIASASVGPFAFGARLIDLPIAFILGSLVGLLQLHLAPRSELYSNVFEISAAVATSFLARAFGSINGGNTFCFSALAQSSIALILPGYTVLCASLELQSRSIVAGSVRMVYAIIYSLFLGFGIMIGTAIYGRLDSHATSATSCQASIQAPYTFISVPIFTLCLIVINQGKWKQTPVMTIIAFSGYIVNFFTAKHFASNTQIANTLGAFTIGVMANLYSRIGKRAENFCLDQWENHLSPPLDKLLSRLSPRWTSMSRSLSGLESGAEQEKKQAKKRDKKKKKVGYGLAAAAMLPAIFVQVPSGLSVSGSLVAGLASANQINSKTNGTSTNSGATVGLNSVAFDVSYSVVQVAIGITVGLFLAAVVVYPSGKRRSGLFSF